MPRWIFLVAPWFIQIASAQSTIHPSQDKAYSANAGWIDLRPSDGDGVQVTEGVLSGFGHAANFGWVSFGNGSPLNGFQYSNTSATDYGVNLSGNGLLTGRAYSANIGWVIFEQTHGKPRLNLITGEFSGFAYAANAGWIGLKTSSSDLIAAFVATLDSDADSIADSYEYRYFGDLTSASATSDSDNDGQTDASEYQANTSPTDASEFLSFRVTGGNTAGTVMAYELTVGPGRVYTVQESETLLSNSWTSARVFVPTSGYTAMSAVHSHPVGPVRFLRLAVTKPLQP